MRRVKEITTIQPLQMTTVELKKNSYIPGTIGAPVNIVGTGLAAKITLTRNANVRMPDGLYTVKVANVGAVGVGTFTVTNEANGTTSAALATAATAIAGVISGVDIKVSDTTGLNLNDYAQFEVIGDQTFIIPGTVLGRIKTGTHKNKWEPATDATIASYDSFLIAQTFQETDKSQSVRPNGYEINISQVYTIDAITFGVVRESVCREINLTDNLKAKITGVVWM